MFSSLKRLEVILSIALTLTIFISVKALCGKFPGEISQIKGTVEVQKAGRTQWYKAVDGLPLQLKDRIRTQKGSSCNLELDDGSLIFVDENTEASVEFIEVTQEKHTSTLGLWLGKLLNNIKKTPSTKMKIKCPTAVISVRGTEFAVEVSTQNADIGVFEGEVAVSSATEMSGEELETQTSTSTAIAQVAVSTEAAQVLTSTAAVQVSTSVVQAAVLAEISVKPGEETTVSQGEQPKPPSKLSLLMQRNEARLNELRGRVQELREKLKRTKPEYLDKVRQKTLDRVTGINEQRNQLREKINNERNQIK